MPPIHLTPVVKTIAILNFMVFILTGIVRESFNIEPFIFLGMHDLHSPLFQPWQIISHMFMHDGIMHIASNMFALILYGPFLERQWGGKKFLQYYIITAIGAVVLYSSINYVETDKIVKAYNQYVEEPNAENFLNFAQKNPTAYHFLSFKNDNNDKEIEADEFAMLWHKSPNDDHLKDLATSAINSYFLPTRDRGMVGASGAVYGLLIAFGIICSEVTLFYGIPGKYIVFLHGATEIYSAYLNNPGDNVAHFAHIGGMIFGYILIKFWRHKKNSIF